MSFKLALGILAVILILGTVVVIYDATVSGEGFKFLKALSKDSKSKTGDTTSPGTQPTSDKQTCHDSDSGRDYYVRGCVTVSGVASPSTQQCDTCVEDPAGNLKEMYCKKKRDHTASTSTRTELFTYEIYDCPYGCEDGACLPEPPGEYYFEGETITKLEGKCAYEGQQMSIKFEALVLQSPSTYAARLGLYDLLGNLINVQDVAAGEDLSELFVDEDGDYALKDRIVLDQIVAASTPYIVISRNGYNTVPCQPQECTDEDEDGYFAQDGCNTEIDCDDSDPLIHPGAEELCDEVDNDCDGTIDEGCQAFEQNQDEVIFMDQTGDYNYTIKFSDGIPVVDTPNAPVASGNKFIDGPNDNIQIPWFGELYTVCEVDVTGTEYDMLLMKEESKANYYEGDEVTGLAGKNSYQGQELTVVVVSVTQPVPGAYKAIFSIYDEEGTLINTQTNIPAGTFLQSTFVDQWGDYVLATPLYVEDVGYDEEEEKGYASLAVGTDFIQLRDNKQYPYDSGNTNPADDYWNVDMPSYVPNYNLDVNVIKQITIYNSVQLWNRELPIYPEEGSLTGGEYHTATLLENEEEAIGYNYSNLTFKGWKGYEPNDTLKIGNNNINYKDTGDFQHNIPIYIELTVTETERSFKVDNQTFYYKLEDENNTLSIARVPFSQASPSDYILKDEPYTNGEVMQQTADLTGDGMNNQVIKYSFMLDDETYDSFWLILQADTNFNVTGSSGFEFLGTDTTENGNINVGYYLPDNVEFGYSSADNDYLIAQFRHSVAQTAGYSDYTDSYVDTATDKLIALPNLTLSHYGHSVEHTTNYNDTFGLREDNQSIYMRQAYSDYGTLIELLTGTCTATVPETRAKPEIEVCNSNGSQCNAYSKYQTSKPGATAEFLYQFDSSEFSYLYDNNVTFKYAGTNYSQRMYETIGIEADAWFDYVHT